MEEIRKYMKFYEGNVGKRVAKEEANYISSCFKNCIRMLSVGCGPAVVEGMLANMNPGLMLVGLDISKEMLFFAPSSIMTIIGNAEDMPFENECFDAVLFLTSLEFISDYNKGVDEAHRVLKSKGMILILMLNPQSQYFRDKYRDKSSYIRGNIKHKGTEEIKRYISRFFSIEKEEYFLGIKNGVIFESNDPTLASLYVLKGIKYGE